MGNCANLNFCEHNHIGVEPGHLFGNHLREAMNEQELWATEVTTIENLERHR